MADNRLYGGDVVNPAMMGGANVQPKQQSLSGYTGSGQSNILVKPDLTEYDPYHRLKMSTLAMIGQSLEQGMEAQREQAYVDGMSKAISGQAESAIESNFLTRNYGNAGYRDMEGKLALIDYKATGLRDLEKDPKLAKYTPEAYQKYLADAKERTMTYISNASTKTKGKLMEQLIAEDFSLVQKQAQLYAASVFNGEVDSTGKMLNLSIVDLNSSRGVSGAYEGAAVGAGLNIQDILTNDRLDYGSKQKLIQDYLESLSSNGHSDLARQLSTQAAFDIDGTNLTLAEWMSFDSFSKVTDSQNKGDKAWRDDRLKNLRMGILDLVEQAKSDPNMDYDGAIAQVYNLISNNGLPSSEGFATIKELTKLKQSGKDSYDVMRALFNGDKLSLVEMDVTEGKAIKQYFQTFKNKTPSEKMVDLIGIANNGITEALDGIGTVAEPTLVKLLNQGAEGLQEGDIEILNSFIGLYNNRYFQENPQYTFNEVLAGVKNPNAAMFLEGALNRYMEQIPVGDVTSTEEVKAQAWEVALQEQRMFHLDNPYAKESNERMKKAVYRSVDEVKTDRYAPGNIFRMSPFGTDASKGFKPNRSFKEWVPFFELGQGGVAASDYATQAYYEEVRNQTASLIDTGTKGSPDLIRKQAEREVSKHSLLLEGDNFAGTYVGIPKAPVADFLRGSTGFDSRGFEASELASSAITALTDRAVEGLKRPGMDDLKVVVRQVAGGRFSVTAWDSGTGIQQDASFSLQDVLSEANRVADDLAITRDVQVAEGFTMYVPNPEVKQRYADTRTGASTSKGHHQDIELKINSTLDSKWKGNTKLDSEEIIATRTSLVEYEGVKLQRYKDGDGYSVGVGIHTGNKNIFPSRIKGDSDVLTQAELQNSFVSASTYAINLADRASKDAPQGLDMPKYRMLLTHLAYQQGQLSDASTTGFIEAMIGKDKDTAAEMLQSTKAFKASGRERQSFYMELLQSL